MLKVTSQKIYNQEGIEGLCIIEAVVTVSNN